ncbi:MAG: S24/S26 family peptidase [Candidatus Omnitrophica bacterium]|nr:S24/S26 family peptidase [Candidatus Omnitrophota bacterium]
MGWATHHIAKLTQGETVSFRPRGHSMSPKIKSGQLCTVEPVEPNTLKVGDIVLCKVRGNEYLHLVKAIQDKRFQIGNNRGRINGWIGASSIFGRLVRVEE